MYENLGNYTQKPMGVSEVEHGNLKCHFKYDLPEDHDEFMLVAYSGARTFANGKFSANIQVCGIVPKCLKCHDSMYGSPFANLEISGNFDLPSSVMPVALDTNLFPLTSKFNYSENRVQFSNVNIYSAALYARNYDD